MHGIIAGKKQYIDQMKKNPLTRAFRIDKMTLAALEATLRVYQDGERPYREIPILRMLAQGESELRQKAGDIAAALWEGGVQCEVRAGEGQVGGGSVPTHMLPTFCVAVTDGRLSPAALDARLRGRDVPVVGRIAHETYLMDVRTLLEGDEQILITAVKEVFEGV